MTDDRFLRDLEQEVEAELELVESSSPADVLAEGISASEERGEIPSCLSSGFSRRDLPRRRDRQDRDERPPVLGHAVYRGQ